MNLFFSCYERKDVTPYLHILSAHYHEFKMLSIPIQIYNLQGLEKLNDLTTSQFFRATNQRNNKNNAKSKTNAFDPRIIELNPFTNDESFDEESESPFINNRLWIKQMIDLRNRRDEMSFE